MSPTKKIGKKAFILTPKFFLSNNPAILDKINAYVCYSIKSPNLDQQIQLPDRSMAYVKRRYRKYSILLLFLIVMLMKCQWNHKNIKVELIKTSASVIINDSTKKTYWREDFLANPQSKDHLIQLLRRYIEKSMLSRVFIER